MPKPTHTEILKETQGWDSGSDLNNTFLNFILNFIEDQIVISDDQGRILFANKPFTVLAGYQPDDLQHEPYNFFYHPTFKKPISGKLRRLKTDEPITEEIAILSRDEKLIPVSLKMNRFIRNGQKLIVFLYRDLRKIKRSEVELNLLSHALKNITESLCVFDARGNILFVNEVFEQAHRLSKDEIIGRSITEIHSRQLPDSFFKEYLESSLKGGWSGEIVDRTKDGKEFAAYYSTSPVPDDQGRPVVIVAVSRDLTERKVLEDQLRQSQKMEAIGQLAGGVAHDFNNMLTVIDGYVELLAASVDENKPYFNYIKQIQRASERAGSVTSQLLAFSRRQILQPKSIDVNHLVKEMSNMLDRLIGENIQLKTSLSSKAGRIKADPSQVEQVLMNLVVNALDAMPDGGHLTIATERVYLDDNYKKEFRSIHAGSYVLITISDSGIGMSKETQRRIFEPFFTTKDKGKGTGLGLATVYGIVKQSGGHIWVYSEEELGTTFKVYLPSIDTETEIPSGKSSKRKTIKGTERILVVEDEFMVRELVRDSLRNYGYEVLEASNGQEAKEIMDSLDVKIDLILTDVVMPGISGRQLADKLSKIQPDAKILYMSGYTDAAIVNHGVLEADMAFIQKPFAPMNLVNKVQEVLAG